MKYSIAADGSAYLESKAIQAGRRVSSGGGRVPAGDSHAVAAGAEVTLCGIDVGRLARFDELDFETTSMIPKCRKCAAAVAVPSE